jgi:UDP-glucuronate 4-epimerase
MMRTALVTGAAGFIGFHTCRALLKAGWRVTGLDAMTSYYDPALKEARLAQLQGQDHFAFHRGQIEDAGTVSTLMEGADTVIHLAAQAGVRYSIDAPRSYVTTNLIGAPAQTGASLDGINQFGLWREYRHALPRG